MVTKTFHLFRKGPSAARVAFYACFPFLARANGARSQNFGAQLFHVLCILTHSHEGNLPLLTEIAGPGVTEANVMLPAAQPENLGVIQGRG